MRSCSVVLLESDVRIARSLALSLQNYFDSVTVVFSVADFRVEAQKHPMDLLIVDVESACLGEVRKLHKDFPRLSIVCTHRLADERMWAEALNAGASDLCAASDYASIIQSAVGQVGKGHSAAA